MLPPHWIEVTFCLFMYIRREPWQCDQWSLSSIFLYCVFIQRVFQATSFGLIHLCNVGLSHTTNSWVVVSWGRQANTSSSVTSVMKVLPPMKRLNLLKRSKITMPQSALCVSNYLEILCTTITLAIVDVGRVCQTILNLCLFMVMVLGTYLFLAPFYLFLVITMTRDN